MQIGRRPATTTDEGFARGLHESGYKDVVVRQFGKWNQEQQEHFFADKWLPEKYEILLHNQTACGYLWVEEESDSVAIMEIVILPEYQNKGIGSRMLRQEMMRARARNVPVKLRVLRKSRAVSLYIRFGFREYSRTESHILMKWE
jgi:ribosomal protein S18 acetylase RimI-like enzyme